jgi:hypothetical protein
MSTDNKWWLSGPNIAGLAHDMTEHHDADLGEILDMLDKPWHYDDEWARYQSRIAGRRAAMDDADDVANAAFDAKFGDSLAALDRLGTGRTI